MNAILIKSVFDHIEYTTIIAVVVFLACALLSYHVSMRSPLYYSMFVVEMHTWATRRVVQVLHLGQEFFPPVPWDRLVQRMRARGPRVQGEQRVAISQTNIVIQSPNTVINSPAPARNPDPNLITLWDIEMPAPVAGHVPEPVRDSQFAAAAAIAILARGDDNSLRSTRVFQNSQNQSSEERTGTIPSLNRTRQVNPPLDYVTTDVTYTTPSVSLSVRHQQSARIQDISQTQAPRNEVVSIETPYVEPAEEEDEDDDDLDLTSNSDDSETFVMPLLNDIEEEDEDGEEGTGTSGEGTSSATTPEEEEQTSCSSVPVIEGPSEGRVLIRLKFMNDTEKDTYALLADTVAKFKTEHFTDLSNKVVRLIFQGQLLRDDQRRLEEYGVQAGSVVHCHISTTPYTRPGVPTLEPIVPPVSRRRRINNVPGRRSPPPIFDDPPARRGNAMAANQLFLIISTLLPIISGVRLRHVLRPTTLLALSHWVCNLLVDNGLLEQDGGNESPFQTSIVFYIFVGQMVAVSFFYFYFPDILDRTGVSICIIVFLYIVFVVYSRHRRRQPEPDAQNAIDEESIVQETITLA